MSKGKIEKGLNVSRRQFDMRYVLGENVYLEVMKFSISLSSRNCIVGLFQKKTFYDWIRFFLAKGAQVYPFISHSCKGINCISI